MKLSLLCLSAFAAYLILYYPDVEVKPWEDRICKTHGGLLEVIVSEGGHKTAVCNDMCRHGLVPSYNEQMDKERK